MKQLLNLADRSESGRLTPDEAARLRIGIAALDTARRSGWQRIAELDRGRRLAEGRLACVQSAVRRAQGRGLRGVNVRVLAALFTATDFGSRQDAA